MPHRTVQYDQTLAIFSDIEMGQGGSIDDFPHDLFLADLILAYNRGEHTDRRVNLILNGDTFDFLKTPVEGTFPHKVTSAVAIHKFEKIAGAHPVFFETLRKFWEFAPERRSIHFIVGNHDAEILFPAVQDAIKALVGGAPVRFDGFHLDVGDVHIEHGNQLDGLFRMDPAKPFVQHKDETYLNLPWASVALLNLVLPLQETFCGIDRIKPKKLLFEIVPEMRDFLLDSFWQYWTKSFIKDYVRSSDPLKKVTWGMLKEVFKRSTVFSPDVTVESTFQQQIIASERFRLYVFGHMHETGMWGYGNRKVIQTGCIRDEFMFEASTSSYQPIAKCYLEVAMRNGRMGSTRLMEVECPDIGPEHYPPMPQDFLPKLRAHLKGDAAANAYRDRIEMEKQERKEGVK